MDTSNPYWPYEVTMAMATAVKERPILFSAEMVRAILDGRKTQTRRIVAKPNSEFRSADNRYWDHCDFSATSCFADDGYLHVPCHCQGSDGFVIANDIDCQFCKEFGWEGTRHRLYPKYDPGERLWVRETWRPQEIDADGQVRITCVDSCRDLYPPENWTIPKAAERGNVPSIFMPRWASRITLEITGSRVERLQEISADDCLAEGIEPQGIGCDLAMIAAYKHLWQKINGPDSWDANPWVWVVEFQRVLTA